MDVEVVSDAAGLAGLEEEWTRLEQAVADAGQAAGGTYYLKHHFVSAWWASYRDQPGVELAVLVLRHNGAVVGIAPLATAPGRRAGQPVRRLRFATHGDYLGFLLDPAAPQETVAKKLLAALESELTWQSARLGGIPVATPLGRHLLRSDDYNPHFTLHVENPYIDLSQYADFAEFTSRQIPKHTRKQRRRLTQAHPGLTFRVVDGDEDDVFARIGAVHRAERDYLIQAKGRTERHSLFDDPARWGHYHRVFTETGDCRTFLLEAADGTLAGYRTTFRHGRRLLSWNGAYHPEFADYRIGSMLLHDMLQHLFETREVDLLDLGAGRYPWKFGWTPDFRATYRLRLERDLPDDPVGGAATQVVPVGAGAGSAEHSGPVAGKGPGGRRSGLRALWPGGTGTSAPTTYVVAPHPDDEILRTAGCLTGPGADPGRRVLVAVSDGGSSSLTRRRGWTPEQERACRRAEQAAAWAALTDGRGEIVRLGLPDGALTREAVSAALRQRVPGLLDPGARVLVAAHIDDYHPDHRTVVQAVRELAPADLATSLAPLMADPADPAHLRSQVRPTAERAAAARVAHDAYRVFGQQSVRPEFAALLEQGFRSRLTDPGQPRTRTPGVHGSLRPRILVLGRTRDVLPGVGGRRSLTGVEQIHWAAGLPDGADPDPTDQWVDPVVADPAPGRAGRLRGAARGVVDRLRPHPDAEAEPWAATLRSSSRARLLLADADVVLSADPDTDAALARLGDLVGHRQVVRADRSAGVLESLYRLEDLVAALTDATVVPSNEDGVGNDDPSAAQLSDWVSRAEQIGAALAEEPELVTPWSGVWTQVRATHGGEHSARVRSAVLGALPWDPDGPGAALRAALRWDADLTLGGTPPAADVLTAVAERALAEAGAAMRSRRNPDALDHLSAALAVLFHEALHEDRTRSPLVQDPAGFLAPLWVAPAFRTLVNRDRALSPWGTRQLHPERPAAREAADRPRVLFLGAAAPDSPEVEADTVVVEHYDLARRIPSLARTGMDDRVLRDLAGLLGAQHTRPRFGRSQPPEDHRSRLWELSARLRAADLVLVPQADRVAVWVSHLCPPETTLVVRVGAADTTLPWVHLTRWDRVDQVVVNEPELRDLVCRLLEGLGADVPVVVGELATVPGGVLRG